MKWLKEFDFEWEVGFIFLGCYLGGGCFGIFIFVCFLVVFFFEDLVVGEVDVVILGVFLDMGLGWWDVIYGFCVMCMLGRGIGGVDVFIMIDLGKVLNIVDYGDVVID